MSKPHKQPTLTRNHISIWTIGLIVSLLGGIYKELCPALNASKHLTIAVVFELARFQLIGIGTLLLLLLLISISAKCQRIILRSVAYILEKKKLAKFMYIKKFAMKKRFPKLLSFLPK